MVAQQEQWPSTMSVIGTMEAVHGVTVSADLPGTVAKINFDSGQAVQRRRRSRRTRHPPGARAAGGPRGAARSGEDQLRPHAAAGEGGRHLHAGVRPASAQQKQTEANVGEIRATIERKTIRAPFSECWEFARSTSASICRPAIAIVQLQSLESDLRQFRRAAAGADRRCCRPQRCVSRPTICRARHFTGRVTALDSVVDETTRNVQVQATLPNPEGKLQPGMFVQVADGTGRNRSVITLPASAISYAPYGDSVFVVTDLKDPEGQTYRGVRQQFVKLGRLARRSGRRASPGVKPGDEVVTSGVFKLRNGAAVQVNNKVQPGNNPARRSRRTARMKFTDLFVKRPVLAIVVNLVILIAGLQSIRSLSVRQYPRSDIAVVQVTTVYVGANADLVRGFITTPLERVIASADGIDYMESSSAQGAQHDHRAPEAQLRHQRGAHADPGEGRAGAQRPAARGGGAGHRSADRRQPVRRDVPRLLVDRSRSEPDHRLPDARRAAEAERDQRRAARRHPRRPHLRDAHLAQAGPDGGARHFAVARCATRWRKNNYLSALGSTKGSMVSVNLVANTDLQTAGRVPAAGRQGGQRRRRPARRDRRRRARRRELRPGRPLQRRDRDLHGHLGAADRQLARRHQAGARGDSRHPGAAAGGHEGRHPLRLDRVHPGRDRRSAAAR